MKNLFDYCRKESPSLRAQVRSLVKSGEAKKDVARKFDLKYERVVSWTEDINMRRHYSTEFKEEVRRRVRNGERKSDVARNMNLSTSIVSLWSGRTGRDEWVLNLTEKQLTILNDILAKGYTFPADYGIVNIKQIYKKFRKYIPVKSVNIRESCIYFLESRSEDAFKAFMERYGKKVVSYRAVVWMKKCFGVTNSKKVQEIIRKVKENKILSD